MSTKQVVVVGGSRGLGRGMAEALLERQDKVTVVARSAGEFRGDATDASLAQRVLANVRPDALILNAGVVPPSEGMRDMSWQQFSETWDVDVRITFTWIQAALRLPLAKGARVLIVSSGAATPTEGVPGTGGYVGAKRMQWLMAHYANVESRALDLGIHFQTLLPLQVVPETGVGVSGARHHAKHRGISEAAFWDGITTPMSARQVGAHVATILHDAAYAAGVAFGVKGDTGISPL